MDYFFLSEEAFRRAIEDDGLLEWAIYNGNYYGTPAAAIDAAMEAGRDVLLDIELLGARQVRKHRPDALMVFIAPPSLAELERRLRGRGDTTADEISGRLSIARSQMEEAAELFDYVVVNDDLQRATDEVANLINRPR